ncbi:MAG: PDZ domain-containing protein, partial [Planctomycetes bacterium]|nr:PDZ domain-containing protein [Planctomycetota bacterium]
AALRQAIAARRPGSSVRLGLFRDRETREVVVELGEVPSGTIEAGVQRGSGVPRARTRVEEYEPLRKLGIEEAATLSAELAQRLGSAEKSGVLVQRVRANSAAQAAGLRPGLVIVRVMAAAVASVDELARALAQHDLLQGVRLTVRSDGQERFLFVRLPR